MVFFYPKTIEAQTSKINGEVKVIKLFGTYRVVAGGYTQSGGLVHAIWKTVLKEIKRKNQFKKPNILILGFGAGSAALIAHNLWPEAQITGIELDPVIIKFANNYFRVDTIPKLKIINEDAIEWVIDKEKNKKEKFDIILVDLYIGGEPPAGSIQPPFIKAVSNLLENNGIALFNRLIKDDKKREEEAFTNKLSKVFNNVKKVPTPANVVYEATMSRKTRSF